MSLTHPFAALFIADATGQLLLTPCPGTQEVDLQMSLQQLAEAGIAAILTLMPEEEIYRNHVDAMPSLCDELHIQWIHLPIEDDHAPAAAFHDAWNAVKSNVHALLSSGKSIAIHCKGGSGRTGTVAAQVLLERGFALDDVLNRVRAARPTALRVAPQLAYIEKIANTVEKIDI